MVFHSVLSFQQNHKIVLISCTKVDGNTIKNSPKAGNGFFGSTPVPNMILPNAMNGIPNGFSHIPPMVSDR